MGTSLHQICIPYVIRPDLMWSKINNQQNDSSIYNTIMTYNNTILISVRSDKITQSVSYAS